VSLVGGAKGGAPESWARDWFRRAGLEIQGARTVNGAGLAETRCLSLGRENSTLARETLKAFNPTWSQLVVFCSSLDRPAGGRDSFGRAGHVAKGAWAKRFICRTCPGGPPGARHSMSLLQKLAGNSDFRCRAARISAERLAQGRLAGARPYARRSLRRRFPVRPEGIVWAIRHRHCDRQRRPFQKSCSGILCSSFTKVDVHCWNTYRAASFLRRPAQFPVSAARRPAMSLHPGRGAAVSSSSIPVITCVHRRIRSGSPSDRSATRHSRAVMKVPVSTVCRPG